MVNIPQYIHGDRMTEIVVTQAIECFRANVPLPKDTILNVIYAARDCFWSQPTLIGVGIRDGEKITVCGDIHGQLFDLLEIFKLNGFPKEDNLYLFNGDFVDRGPCSVEVAFILYAYKLLHPEKFFVNRGNHEMMHEHVGEGFRKECLEKYDQEIFDAFSDSFQALPLATVIGQRYFVVHGGVPIITDFGLDDIRNLPRVNETDLRTQLLWNDPVLPEEKFKTPRGGGQLFDQTVTDVFLKKERLSMIIRSHEFTAKMAEGHKVDGNCVTVFSAANYQGGVNNGAYINITKNNYDLLTFQSPNYPDWYNPYVLIIRRICGFF